MDSSVTKTVMIASYSLNSVPIQQLQVSAQHSQLHTCGGVPGVVSTEQNVVVQGSKYDESQQNTVPSAMSQPNAASISWSSACESQVVELPSAATYAPPNSVELENINNPISSTFPTSKFRRSSIAVFRPSGIGLHLNSLVNALPMDSGASASVRSAEEYCMIVQGKRSLCTTDSHSTADAGNSAKGTDLLLKPTHEHHSTSCDDREYPKLNAQKKRKRSTGFSGEDSCKGCNCKKTKCLKLNCDCFAAGYYCAETCSCQGCFNSPKYEDIVLDTRRHIVSRNPAAFAPKILPHVGESLANNIQDNNKSTPSSARNKRGCNCKKSMCMKRYCECYQSNVGCSDGCRCAGCKNVYGKKEANDLYSSESGSSEHTSITETSNDIPEISFNNVIEETCHTISESELPVVLDSDSKFYNILEDDDITELLKQHPVSFSPPHSRFPELRPTSSSITALGGGRKFILKAVPSSPPHAPSTDVKSVRKWKI